MGKKMYYSEQEACQKLGLSIGQINKLVNDGKLRVFADGPRKMFKSEEIEALAQAEPAAAAAPASPATTPPAADTGEIILTPADSTAHDAIALSDDSGLATIPTEGTVATNQGVSVFDEADLEIESADPMAKTSMAPSVEDSLSAESVGSGSGLLDLTREPDDTSLGAVLEDINVESGAGPGSSGTGSGTRTGVVSSSGVAAAVAEEEGPMLAEEALTPSRAVEPAVVTAIDPMGGLFSGLAIASCIIMLVLAAVAIPSLVSPEVLPSYVATLQANLPIVLAGVAVVAILFAVIGYVTGRSAATRSAALQK